MAKKNKSNGTINATIEVDRLILILALVGVIFLSATIGFIFGIISAPLDYDSNPAAVARYIE